MIVRDVIDAMEGIAPRGLAEPWDNTGLIIGAAGATVRGPVLLTIDLTEAVMREAEEAGAGVIIAYHPPIFEGLKAVSDATRAGRVALWAAGRGVAVYSPHTALDAAPGGMTDWLADGLSLGSVENDRRALVPARVGPGEVKVVTFVPADAADSVRDAMAGAGAGVIGAYTRCSFMTPGTGTFHGGEGASPAVGSAGRLECVEERRLEMVCPRGALAEVLAALRGAHPYEEPAIDVLPLEPVGTLGGAGRVGAGRAVTLEAPIAVRQIGARLRAVLGVSGGGVQTTRDVERMVRVIGVCPGAGGSLIDAAKSAGCEALVTGEMKHHEVLAAVAAGLSVVLGGHTQTERGYLPVLAGRLSAALEGARVLVSTRDAAPMADPLGGYAGA